jgi:hypothetical protein
LPHGANHNVVFSPLKKLTATANSSPAAVKCVIPTGATTTTQFDQTNCPYNIGDIAKWCQIPNTDPNSTIYKNLGIGDPVWSGGDL